MSGVILWIIVSGFCFKENGGINCMVMLNNNQRFKSEKECIKNKPKSEQRTFCIRAPIMN